MAWPVAFLKSISARRRDPGITAATSSAVIPSQAFSRMNARALPTRGRADAGRRGGAADQAQHRIGLAHGLLHSHYENGWTL